MLTVCRKLAPIFMLFIAFTFIEGGLNVNHADARSRMGGRSFRSVPIRRAPSRSMRPARQQRSGSFGRGMAGGLLGGALGGMLFGSMFGGGGSGMGILPMLLLGGVAYFLFKKFSRSGQNSYREGGRRSGPQNISNIFDGGFGNGGQSSSPPPPPPPDIGANLLDDGLEQIRQSDSGFDSDYFLEIASDIFFQVQAGWIRRDLSSYRHLLGEQLAGEYERHFTEMREKGQINKLESIAIRNVKIVQAGADGKEDFVTVLFSANLLDYTVDDKSGDLIEGSMTNPVKFEEEWTWARPVGTQDWKLEGIK